MPPVSTTMKSAGRRASGIASLARVFGGLPGFLHACYRVIGLWPTRTYPLAVLFRVSLPGLSSSVVFHDLFLGACSNRMPWLSSRLEPSSPHG